jgi:hypothetical protein
VGLRGKDENGVLTKLAERKKDGALVLYSLDDKLQLQGVILLDKHGNLFSVDAVLNKDRYKRTWYWPDGKTIRAVLDVSSERESFTVYDEAGGKRFEDLEVTTDEEVDPELPPYYNNGRKQTVQTFTVYNGSPTPKYTQTVGRSYSYNGYGGQPEVVIESVDVYEPGSTTVARRITPKVTKQIGSEYKTVTKVETFLNGEVRYVRYLDEKNRILRMVENTPGGEVVTDVADVSTAAVEPLDAAMLQSPETPADLKLAEAMVAGNTDMHLQRLLVP